MVTSILELIFFPAFSMSELVIVPFAVIFFSFLVQLFFSLFGVTGR